MLAFSYPWWGLEGPLSFIFNDGLVTVFAFGVHAGEASPSEDDYYGIAVNQAARLRGVAHGGQTVVSSVVIRRQVATAM